MRWANHINLRITMPPHAGQDGHCGNFNGDSADDTTDKIRTRVGLGVAEAHSLFQHYQAAVPGKKVSITDCEPAKMIAAREKCIKSGRKDIDQCTLDGCFA